MEGELRICAWVFDALGEDAPECAFILFEGVNDCRSYSFRPTVL